MQSSFRLSLTGLEEIVTCFYRIQACFCLGPACFKQISSSGSKKQSCIRPCVLGSCLGQACFKQISGSESQKKLCIHPCVLRSRHPFASLRETQRDAEHSHRLFKLHVIDSRFACLNTTYHLRKVRILYFQCVPYQRSSLCWY